MNKKTNIGLGVLILLLIALSCKKGNRQMEIEILVKEWTGKTIQFTEDVRCKN
jgi:hypothetical protein